MVLCCRADVFYCRLDCVCLLQHIITVQPMGRRRDIQPELMAGGINDRINGRSHLSSVWQSYQSIQHPPR